MTSLRSLQEAIKDGKKPRKPSLLPIIERTRLTEDEPIITDDLYASAKIGMKLGLLNPNEVMIDGIDGAITRGPDVTQLIGLALRFGANPNIYVRLRDNGKMTNMHILYYIWLKTPKNDEDIKYLHPDIEQIDYYFGYYMGLMEDMIAMLVIGGADPKSPTTDLPSEVQEQTNPQVETVRRLGNKIKSVKYNIREDGSTETDELTIPAEIAFNAMTKYAKMRERLIDFVDVDDVAYDMAILLDADDAITIESPSISKCITGHANKCLEKTLNLKRVTHEDVERFLEEAIDSYNVPAVVMLIERGAVVRYNIVDRIILASGKNAIMLGRPLNSALQNRMMLEMAKRGVGFDKPQTSLITSYSPKTGMLLDKIQTVPYWRRTCKAKGDVVRPELRNLAREIGLPPGTSKGDICMELHKIDKVPESQLGMLASKLQRRRLEARKTSLGDLVTGRTQKALKTVGGKPREKTICVNENLLPRNRDGKLRKPEDFSDLDIVLLESKGKTYCFTSEDYESLLESRTNPLADNEPLTKAAINEIKAKQQTLLDNNLPITSMGPTNAIRKIKAEESADSYDEYTKQRTVDFLVLASNDYGIPAERFTEDLSNIELEQIATAVTGIEGTTFDIVSKQRSVRSFGNTMMELVDRASNIEDVDGIFMDIRDMINRIFERE